MSDKIIILRESFLRSVASDGVTFAMLAGLPYLNHRFSGGSGWIDFAIALGWLVVIVSRGTGFRAKNTYTPEAAREWLDDEYPPEAQQNQ